MGIKTGKLNQGDSDFIKFFFDLFYRTHWNQNGNEKEYFKIINTDLLPTSKDINVLICGAGSCVHELPVLLTLFESNKNKNVNLTFVDKAREPFKLLHFILKKYGETKCRNSIEKNKIANYFDHTQDYDIKTDESYSICNSNIEYTFHVMDLELDPHETATTNRYTEFNKHFNGKKYDIVMMSMFLQHISYWRSLIAFLNRHLKEDGYFWINEFGKDDYLLTLDLYMAIIDNKRKRKEEWKDFEKRIIDFFEKEYYRDKNQMLFSIISDNDEISPTNTEICRDFFDFFGSKGQMVFEEGFQANIKPSELFKNAKIKFSPFTKLYSFLEGETLSPSFSKNKNDEKMDFTMTWYAYPKVTDNKIKHFDVLDEDATPMKIPVLQQCINQTLDILNLNSTIFRPTFLRREGTSKKLVESTIDLFRRFQLFKIGDFQSIVFFIPDITTVKCLNDTTRNYIDDFTSQKKFLDIIDKYNDAIKDTGESNSTLFFDKYKTMMTKPFSISLEPLERPNNIRYEANIDETLIDFKIDEYGHSPNQKVHIIKVMGYQTDSPSGTTFVTPLRVNYNHSSLTTLYKAFNEHFDKYRSILIPCFREPLFDKNKEFLGDLIIFQEKGNNSDNTSIEFFSWLIRKFIDFTQIATYLDYKRIIHQSLKSAISAIMSRNMSHNLGSHCMHYTKSALENLSGHLSGHGPEVRGAARLISYIQGRMDFLATLVSGEEYPYGAVNFKSQIVDVLTVDEFSKRHYKASSTREKYKIIKQSKLQTSLETLSSQLDAIIRDRKERNGAELSRVVNATESLINQLENLKLDNADLRTTNFLLENLIKSERFYRESIYDTPSIPQNITDKPFYLYVRYNGELFTGSEHNIIEEETVKAKLSELNIAMPGGLMSTHAFFNIVENLIRNSAKHRAVDLTESALITTIDVRDEKSKGKHRLRFTIFDNKHNANIAYPIIIEQLKGLQILNSDDASINKKSKGFKEMLIAALWLKSNEGEDSFSELLNKIEREKDGATKLSLIKEYAYEIVKVDNHGNDSESEDSNLGLRFYLPYFDTCATFNVNEVQGEAISQGIINSLREEQVKADIVVMDEREEIMQEAYKRFPRLYDKKTIVPQKEISIIEEEIIENKKANKVSFNETLMLYSIMKRRFGDDIIKYQVVFGESPKSITSPANIIYFQRHFNKSQDFSEALNFMYADSVSGGNFTVTLQDNYLRGQSPDGRSLTWKDKYFSYKIIESALTRITLIDERLSDDYNDLELKSKNLRVLNLNPETPDENEIWSGSSFKDEDDYTLFLSIHLGLIEKVINNENNWFMNQYNKEFANNDNKRPERATFFMDLLRRKFGKGKEIFISVHSGRGNYSYDLEHSLKEYPFINLSAIESVFSNSKYLLAQLFYNTIYIGKGEYNQKQS